MFPLIPLELLQALIVAFPEKSPSPGEKVKDLRHRGGQASVIRFLQRKYDEQNDNVLTVSQDS